MSILKGYRVLDCSRIFAAPLCTMMLADMGAEVIKVENSDKGDDTRGWGPPFAKEKRDAYYFMSMNRNKKSLTLNLANDKAKGIIYELAKKSDIFVHNYVPGRLKGMGLDYETMNSHNKSLIYASVSGFGDEGEYANKGALDFTIQAMSGIMAITGPKGGTPYKTGFAITDVLAGQQLFGAVMAGCLARERDPEKKGMKLESGMLHSSLYSQCYVPFSGLNSDFDYKRIGNNHPNIVPYGTYSTKEGVYLVVGAATEGLFKKLCKIVNITDDEYAVWETNSIRAANSDEFNKFLQSKFDNFSKDFLIPEFEAAGIPYSEITTHRELFEKPIMKEINMVKEVPSKNYDQDLKYITYPVTMKHTENKYAELKEPPRLGQHTDEILSDLLGYSKEKISNLRKNKIV